MRVAPEVLHLRRLEVESAALQLRIADLRIAAGEQLAIIGRNGAGKTTLLESCLGLRAARRLDATLFGRPLTALRHDLNLRRRLGVQLQNVSYAPQTRVGELEELHAAMYGEVCQDVAARLDIAALRAHFCHTLSRGQKQRLDLYLALAHRPQFVVLDEPLAGLDRRFCEAVLWLLAQRFCGAAVLMVCHTPEEVAAMHEVLWIDAGRVRARATSEVLTRDFLGEFHLKLAPNEAARAPQLLNEMRDQLSFCRHARVDDGAVELWCGRPSESWLRDCAGRSDLRRFEFAATGVDSLLGYCAGNAERGVVRNGEQAHV